MRLTPTVIEIVVADMAASLRFYRDLGLDIPPAADSEDHVELDLGGMKLAFDTEGVVRSFDPDWSAPTGGHRMGLAFECASPAAVDSAWKDLVAAGHNGHLAPWDAVWGMRYAVLRDPNGVAIDLYAPLPRA